MQQMAQQCKAFITGIAGTVLSPQEKAFITEHCPWGFILFGRNIDNADQLCRLTQDLRLASGRENVAILIDQEGGRVRRLRPPLVADYPAAAMIGKLYRRDKQAGMRAAWAMSRLHAFDLRRFGINVNCLPVLDVLIEGAHEAIGSRSYGQDAQMVSLLGKEAAQGLLAGGVLPVMKHIPGQGRALQDTHFDLAHVDAPLDVLRKSDFIPFRALNNLPAAMNSHLVYDAVDKDNPTSFSAKMVTEIIRGEIGFDGLLLSDDIGMQALSGSFASRAHRCLMAGFDLVLHCSGQIQEMQEVAKTVPNLEGQSLARAQAAMAAITPPDHTDEAHLRQEFSSLMEVTQAWQ